MRKYYAGIGSRSTPESVRPLINRLSAYLFDEDYVLRSGGAEGADSMFEEGIPALSREIYLPWKMFHSNMSPLFTVSAEAMDLTKRYHPNWTNLTVPVRHLMGRNAYQVLGEDLRTKSDFIVCWTPNGETHEHESLVNAGGTGQALRIAKAYGIPIFNLNGKTFEDFMKFYTDHLFDIL